MMPCAAVIAELGEYLDDQVAAQMRHAIEEHLSRCRQCRVVYDSTRRTLEVVVDEVGFELSEELSERILERLRTRLGKLETG